jgi:hypothetical protein
VRRFVSLFDGVHKERIRESVGPCFSAVILGHNPSAKRVLEVNVQECCSLCLKKY